MPWSSINIHNYILYFIIKLVILLCLSFHVYFNNKNVSDVVKVQKFKSFTLSSLRIYNY